MELAQLVVFVRPPTAGKAKTRLTGLYGPQGAADLYRAFVEDTLDLCERVLAGGRVDVSIWSTGPDDRIVSDWAQRVRSAVRFQPEGDLGSKLSVAFAEGLQRYERVVVIGSDMPTLPVELIDAAFDSLERAPFMLGPSNDGGYYAVGATHRVRPSFENVRWSTVHTMLDTVKANAQHPLATIPPWYDIDAPEDLPLLRAHLSVEPSAAPATAAFLAALTDRA